MDNKGESFSPPYKPRKISLPKSPPLPTLPNDCLAGNPGTPSRKRWEKEEEKTPSRERREKKKKTSSVPVIPECLYQESKSEEKNLRREKTSVFSLSSGAAMHNGGLSCFSESYKGISPGPRVGEYISPGAPFSSARLSPGVLLL